ncbi:MAG: 2OG-Fe(II) oxygenase [Gomphosphaeria aponina SAG 52.96 = DSM 107014]|uniref:2OG-Fe(II) oxygenase n=1 Tax=Gomphosphaeria aponina SAG 52.96 = DSM 107014 TaxID=1521640 RepID=A0A941GMJ9_9CHRO|nr:2OG-Fe(II) oxygenase [Gomphosphaeria aponina SAG 52.96 = DSM 107014]
MNTSATLTFCLDPEYLNNLATKHREAYALGKPFPHIIMDNFLPASVLDQVLEEFPQPNSVNWQKFNAATEKKLASTSELQMGEATRFLLYQLNSSVFIQFLEKLTGIDGLLPDPHFIGGGLHQIVRGGYLKLHADFNRHITLPLDRRLNLLIYLNKDWEEEYGGHFEMWNRDMTRCEQKVLPIFNRCVIFSTTDFSYHGHPDPLTCPEGGTRKSLALYYYSNGRPPEEIGGSHTTLFRERPGENLKSEIWKVKAQTFARKLIPPLVTEILQNQKTKQ